MKGMPKNKDDLTDEQMLEVLIAEDKKLDDLSELIMGNCSVCEKIREIFAIESRNTLIKCSKFCPVKERCESYLLYRDPFIHNIDELRREVNREMKILKEKIELSNLKE